MCTHAVLRGGGVIAYKCLEAAILAATVAAMVAAMVSHDGNTNQKKGNTNQQDLFRECICTCFSEFESFNEWKALS